MSGTSCESDARVIVAIDFGTTFSGFAFAHTSQPDQVFTNYDWPLQARCGGMLYCKTITALRYCALGHQLDSWGWPAQRSFTEKLHSFQIAQQANGEHPLSPACKQVNRYLQRLKLLPGPKQEATEVGHYLTRFKLLLAPQTSGLSNAPQLPPGLTANRVVSDYLREMGEYVVTHLKKRYGEHMCKNVIQWCVTVPSIWDNASKQQMYHCMELAGLIDGEYGKENSPFPPILVLEPEAAAMYCYKFQETKKGSEIQPGDKFLVADIGGGTTDIVVQERVNLTGPLVVQEVMESSGALCGGTNTDANFLSMLEGKIGCLRGFLAKNASMRHILLQLWERTKCTFDGTCSADIQLPSKLALAWEAHDTHNGRRAPSVSTYDEVELSVADLLQCFDPVVADILDLISAQMAKCGGVKVMMVVGGFSGSPYLMKRIRGCFGGDRVQEILNPPNPGSAVCQGAVILGMNRETIQSRVLKRTYGIRYRGMFQDGDLIADKVVKENGDVTCRNIFDIYAKKGTVTSVGACQVRTYAPISHNQKRMTIALFSSASENPRRTTEKRCKKEAKIVVDMSDLILDMDRRVKVSMFFGRSSVELTAEAVNFNHQGVQRMLPVKYVCDWK